MTDQKYTCTVICLFLCSIFEAISAQGIFSKPARKEHNLLQDLTLVLGGNRLSIPLLNLSISIAPIIECDKSKCPGPIAYYEALGCTPIYSTEGDCCAVRYNCDFLKERSRDNCYVNGRAYEVGESLRDEDANPCDIGCSCTAGASGGFASFNCTMARCDVGPVKPGCYRKNSPIQCCPGEEVCPENPEDRAKCIVNGREYRDGEYFTVESDPNLSCVCMPQYTGQNVEPFCSRPKRSYCNPEFRNADDVRNNCAPVYYSSQSPATDCSVFSRCQNSNDTVVKSSDGTTASVSGSGPTCKFGQLTMQLGDELNSATDYSSVCVKCVCEVPPELTCQRLPDEECDVTVNPSVNGGSK